VIAPSDAYNTTVFAPAGGGAACDTVNVVPAIVSVPLRAAPVFCATLKLTVPLPLPLAPLVTLIHVALDAAVQVQLVPAVTVTESLPPAAAAAVVVFDSEKLHDGVPVESFIDPSGKIVASLVCGPGAAVK
jgi:hypothetical protein